MGLKLSLNGEIGEGGRQERQRGSPASHGLYGGYEKAGESSPASVLESGTQLQSTLRTG